ncbi:unnamed protein product [Urochloa decumbens]|uniref:MADS-box domain-containing protein n=1 Tax=Urochloa decumbens TaxID=240449 RepID=A0ABC8Z8E8_9POAL
MPRRSRRSGVRFIEDDRDRSLTFFKRRYGIFKAASDLSTLTGARVAMVLESENEKFSSFGTPDASPIVDAFLSGDAPTESDTSEEQKAKITNLQNELFQLEKDKAMEEKREKENIVWTKKIQDTSRMAKYIYGKEEDLDCTELYEMYRELSRITQEINDRLPTLLHDNQVEADDRLRDPSLLQPTWWRPIPSQVVKRMKYFQWTPSQASFQQHPGSSSSHLGLARSGSSCPYSVMLSSQQVQVQPQLLQHPLVPCARSMVQLQAPPPKEAYPYNYPVHGIHISGNNSHTFSPISCSPPPQPSSLQTPPSNDSSPLALSLKISPPMHLKSQQLPYNPQNDNCLHPPQNYANASSTLTSSHQPFYGSSLELNFELGNTCGNGGHTDDGHSKGFDLSTSQQVDDWPEVMQESPCVRESSNDENAGNNLGELNFPW